MSGTITTRTEDLERIKMAKITFVIIKMIKTHKNESFRLFPITEHEQGSLPVMIGKKGRRSQVDKVSKVKFRWYRVSCKEDSEQGQGCRNSIPEPRQEQVIKTSSARDGHGPKHATSPRKTAEEEEHGASLIFLFRSHGGALMIYLFLLKTKDPCI